MKKIPYLICIITAFLFIFCSCSDNTDEQTTTQEPTTQEITQATIPLTVTLTFPEGMTLCEIAQKLEENSVCGAAEFISLANNEALAAEYSFYDSSMKSENRAFLLEGYIFPDTYEFYYDESADTAIRRFLDNTEQKLAGYKELAASQGRTLDEIITIASVIQEEALPVEMTKVSSVLHNRLDNGMQLQCDVTIAYIENSVKPFIDGDKDRFNEYYNTYKCEALPIGAICSPGMQAIEAALYPEDTDYLFFVTDKADSDIYYYAADYDTHLENCERAGW